ncbi:MAG: helix-turn-helix transcriptional regulator [Clostridia bacterium]|nr:helix-turn-helix transcriptional regulator [Clostridia bacterium]
MKTDILSNLVITKVLAASTLYTPEKVKIKRTHRKRWAVVIKYEGETFYISNGKRFLSDANHVVILPNGCLYDWECTQPGHFAIIEFESEQTFHEPIPIPIKYSEKVLKQFKEIEYKRNLKNPMFEMESIRDVYSIILSITSQSIDKYTPNSKMQKIQPAIEYVSQNFDKRITNDILANVAGLSTIYFRKLFTEVMGISPIAYTKQMRIEKAKEMLKSDYGTLSDIAQSLGYANLYDFSRDFKTHTGKAPSKY